MDLENSLLLEKVIIDASALKEAALKSAQNEILEKNVNEIRESVNKFLNEQDLGDEENPLAGLMGGGGNEPQPQNPVVNQIPLGATDGTNNCSCPEEGEEIEIDFNDLASNQQVSGQTDLSQSMTESGEEIMFESDLAPAGADLMKYYLEEGDAISQVASAMTSSSKVNKDVIKDAINDLTFFKSKVNDEELQKDIAEKINALTSMIGSQEPETASLASSPNSTSMASSLEEDEFQNINFNEMFEIGEEGIEKAFTDFLNQPSNENEFEMDNEFYQVRNEEPNVRIDMLSQPTGDPAGPTAGEEKFGRGVEAAKLSNDTIASKEFERYKRIIKSLREENNSLKDKLTNLQSAVSLMEEVENKFIEVSEMNANLMLENLKLVYSNDALLDVSLNERQKAVILEKVSKTNSIDEAKTVFGLLKEGINNGFSSRKVDTLNEAVKNKSTFILKGSSKEENSTFPEKERMMKLAGIKK